MSTPIRAALGLGSNLGDREAHLQQAVNSLGDDPGVTVVAVSSLVETVPIGGPEQPDYLNAVVIVDTVLSATDLLALAQKCEQSAGRVREERWGPRTLDVDILAYDAVVMDQAVLTLPHPRAIERAFVMVPWAEVDPSFIVAGRSVEAWASTLDASGVRTVGATG